MIQLALTKEGSESLDVLCLGAHSDDIEIGCGGTLLQLQRGSRKIRLHWVVFSGIGVRGEEARKSAELFTAGCESKVVIKEFRDGFLPYDGIAVKEFVEQIKKQVNPDLIFTHW